MPAGAAWPAAPSCRAARAWASAVWRSARPAPIARARRGDAQRRGRRALALLEPVSTPRWWRASARARRTSRDDLLVGALHAAEELDGLEQLAEAVRR